MKSYLTSTTYVFNSNVVVVVAYVTDISSVVFEYSGAAQLSWHAAYADCESRDGWLADVLTQARFDELMAQANTCTEYVPVHVHGSMCLWLSCICDATSC